VGFRAWLPGWTPSPSRSRPSSAPVLCPHGETPGTGEPRRMENDHRGILPHPYDIAKICEVRSEFAAHHGHGRKGTWEPGKAGDPEKPHISAFTRSELWGCPEAWAVTLLPGVSRRSAARPILSTSSELGGLPSIVFWIARAARRRCAATGMFTRPARAQKCAEQAMDGRCVVGILGWPSGWLLK